MLAMRPTLPFCAREVSRKADCFEAAEARLNISSSIAEAASPWHTAKHPAAIDRHHAPFENYRLAFHFLPPSLRNGRRRAGG
jgi:hypothetical protein